MKQGVWTAHAAQTTMLNGDSVDVKSAQKFLGHADLQVTLKIYTHLSEGKEQAAVDALNKYFCNNKG